MINVLFFINDLSGGGAEKVLINLLNGLNKNKFNITLLTIFDTGENKKYLNSDIDYKFIFKKKFRGNIHLLKLFSPKLLYKLIIPKNQDIVISYLEGAPTRIISGGKEPNVKKINWVHNEMTKKRLARPYRNYNEFIDSYKKYDYTVFVAESARIFFEQETKLNKNHIIKYNTIDTDIVIDKSLEKLDNDLFNQDTVNMITVGRLTEQKGYDRLLRIIKDITIQNKKIHLYILGEGHLKKQLVNFIRDNRISEFVTFLGYKKNPYKYLKNADLFVCSSYHEGYSTAVTESLLVGTPIVTTRCSGMEELLGKNNEYGLIVENNEDALLKGITSLLANRELLESYKLKAELRSSYFSKQNTIDEVEELLYSLQRK